MKSGYTLPVFAVASALGSLLYLLGETKDKVTLNLLDSGIGEVDITQIVPIDKNACLAMTISDPGDNLDLTSGIAVWSWVQISESPDQCPKFKLEGGEGIGRKLTGEPAIYHFTYRLAEANLLVIIPEYRIATIRFILPEGRALAQRTSNQAFGILEGLSLLGTTAISHPLSVEEKLEEFRSELKSKVKFGGSIVFYIGANSYQVATKLGYLDEQLVQTANWLGVMLIEAVLLGVNSITLVGYHGKLLKLAGGIFNTSSHITDARIDILVRSGVRNKLPIDLIYEIEQLPTAEAVHNLLKLHGFDQIIFQDLTDRINQRAREYIYKYTGKNVELKTILCDRLGQLVLPL